MFAGLLKCDTCGHTLTASNPQNGPSCFSCIKYKKMSKTSCTYHRLRYDLLYQVVLADLQAKLSMVQQDEKSFAEGVLKHLNLADARKQEQLQREKADILARQQKLAARFEKMYDDRVEGILSENRFREMSARTEAEQEELTARLTDLQNRLGEMAKAEQNVAQFLERIREYSEITELNRELLNRLIEKIVVSERVRDEHGYSQKIVIYYRFIGTLNDECFTK